jgi:hypothetical protein
MDILTASKSLGADRLLLLSLLQHLVQKEILTREDLRDVFNGSLEMIRAFGQSADPVAQVQLGQSEQELVHILRSFRLDR